MSVERYGYLEQTKSASGIARKAWERVETGNGGLKGVRYHSLRSDEIVYMIGHGCEATRMNPGRVFRATNGLSVCAVR